MAKDNEPTKSMDIAKPGKTAPDASSRPILVSHKPVVQDPMVKADESTEEPGAEATTVRGTKVIQPISTESDEKPAEEAVPEVANEEPADTETSSEPAPAAETEASEEKTDDTGNQAAVVDAVAEQANANKPKDNELSEAEKQKQAEMAKLIEDKKYFVPIGQVARRRNRRTLFIFVVLIVVLVGIYLAIDSGALDIGVKLPFDLI